MDPNEDTSKNFNIETDWPQIYVVHHERSGPDPALWLVKS